MIIEIKDIKTTEIVNPGCTNGNYVPVDIDFEFLGKVFTWRGLTCRCRSGCSNTWRLNRIEEIILYDIVELECFLKGNDIKEVN